MNRVTIDKRTYDVKMSVKNMSFSAHADSKGILNLIKHAQPESVVLVHGEKNKMEVISEVIRETLKIRCYYPANHEDLYITVKPEEKMYPIGLDEKLLSIDFSQGLKIPMVLTKTGQNMFGSKMKIRKEFLVRLEDDQSDQNQGLLGQDDQMQLVGGTGAGQGNNAGESGKSKELRILPHKIMRFSVADLK